MSTEAPGKSHLTFAGGMIRVGGILLIIAGLWEGFIGTVALFKQTLYVIGAKWVAEFDLTAWGWIHILLGLALIAVGIFVLRGALWASILAIIVCGLSALANFAWLPYYPLWSILIIAVDVLVIWALAFHREAVHGGS